MRKSCGVLAASSMKWIFECGAKRSHSLHRRVRDDERISSDASVGSVLAYSLSCFILAQHQWRTPHVLESSASLKRPCPSRAQYG
jgi:hypothetical protein